MTRWRVSDKAAPRIVLAALGLSSIGAALYGAFFPSFLFLIPGLPMGRLADFSSWLASRLSADAFELLAVSVYRVAHYSFFIAFAVALVSGPRAWRTGRARRGATLTLTGLVLGLLFSLGPLALHVHVRRSFDRTEAATKDVLPNLHRQLESGEIPEDRRARTWKLYAESMYYEQGIQVQIPDEHGVMTTHQPSEREVSARRYNVEIHERLRKTPYFEAAAAGTWPFLFLALGLFTPVRRGPGVTPAVAAT